MAVPNKDEWLVIFAEIFEDLEKKVLPASADHYIGKDPALKKTSKGEAKFSCKTCKRTWTSLNGYMEFKYELVLKGNKLSGRVTMTGLGQKCKKCTGTDEYTVCQFTYESIEDALNRLHLKVLEKFYEEDITTEMVKLDLRKSSGVGRGVHDSSRCQACERGICQSQQKYGEGYGGYGGSTRGPMYATSTYTFARKIKWNIEFK